jgi:adenosylcobinamide-phosphate synthase
MSALFVLFLFSAAVPMGLALVLDRLLGEPRRFHPLVGFGRYAAAVERLCRRFGSNRGVGLVAWSLAVLPWVALAGSLHAEGGWLRLGLDVGLLYLAVGGRSLAEHARAIAAPLAAGDLAEARSKLSWIVSRDTSQLDESGVAKATVESVLENGNDAIFGALFWFALLGGPGRCCSASPTPSTPCGATATRATCASAGRRRASTTCSTSCRPASPPSATPCSATPPARCTAGAPRRWDSPNAGR